LWNRIINEILKGAGVQNLFTEFEKKLLQWSCNMKKMDRTRMRATKLKFKGKKPMG
jgi:hypothetical protein